MQKGKREENKLGFPFVAEHVGFVEMLAEIIKI